MAAVSVIIPVFNSEKYVARCVESIVAQSFTDLEVILVDDGSTDDSGKICDRLAMRDSRIRVRHCPNRGVSAARNDGIRMAGGEFVSFVDSDDYLSPDAYELLYAEAKEKQADTVYCNFTEVCGGREYEQSSFLLGKSRNETISAMISYGPNAGSIWNYLLIRRSVLTLNSLGFPEKYSRGEDFWFGLRAHCLSRRISKVEKSLYFYEKDNQASLTKRKSEMDELAECLDESFNFLKSEGLLRVFYREMAWRILLLKTEWLMSPRTFRYYYSYHPEANDYVDDNPLLGNKMKKMMRMLNKKQVVLPAVFAITYKLYKRIFN